MSFPYRESVKALLIHGLSSNSTTWWRVAEALTDDGWDVTTPDLRGHGTAPRGDSYSLADYAGDLPTGPWDLVIGHSLGAAIGVLLGHTAKRLVIIDPVLEVRAEDFDEVKAEQLAELELTPENIRAGRPHWSERDLELKIAAVGQVDPTAVERTFSDNPTWDVLDVAKSLTTPTLILSGDPAVYSFVLPETAHDLTAANPLVEYRVMVGTGHSVHRDDPEGVIAAIREFYQRP